MRRIYRQHFQDIAGSPTHSDKLPNFKDAEQFVAAFLESQPILLNQIPCRRSVGTGNQLCNHDDCFPIQKVGE